MPSKQSFGKVKLLCKPEILGEKMFGVKLLCKLGPARLRAGRRIMLTKCGSRLT